MYVFIYIYIYRYTYIHVCTCPESAGPTRPNREGCRGTVPGATWHGQARPSRLEESPRPKKDSANDIAAGALTAYDKHESMPPGFTTLVPFGGPCLRAGGGLGSRVVTHQTPDSRPQGWLGAGILNLESRIRGLNVNTVRTHGSRSKQKHDALRAKRRAGSLNVVSSRQRVNVKPPELYQQKRKGLNNC